MRVSHLVPPCEHRATSLAPHVQVFSDLSHVKMNATKSMIGHCLGAGGPAVSWQRTAPRSACSDVQQPRLCLCAGCPAGRCPARPGTPTPTPRCAVPCSRRHGGDSHHQGHPDWLGAPHHQPREAACFVGHLFSAFSAPLALKARPRPQRGFEPQMQFLFFRPSSGSCFS